MHQYQNDDSSKHSTTLSHIRRYWKKVIGFCLLPWRLQQQNRYQAASRSLLWTNRSACHCAKISKFGLIDLDFQVVVKTDPLLQRPSPSLAIKVSIPQVSGAVSLNVNRMAYLRGTDFDTTDDLGRSALRSAAVDDDYFLQRRIERATDSYSPPLTFVRDTEVSISFSCWISFGKLKCIF